MFEKNYQTITLVVLYTKEMKYVQLIFQNIIQTVEKAGIIFQQKKCLHY